MSDVAEHIRIRSVYLAAIEDENWPAIGAPVYTRGFLRTYARYLGLDPEETVGEFNASSGGGAVNDSGAHGRIVSAEDRVSGRRRGFPALLWTAAVVAVALVAFVVYNEIALHRSGGSGAPVVASSSAPAAGSTDMASAVPAPTPSLAPHTLALVLSAASWLRVTVDGNVRMEGTFPAGTSKTFHGSTVLLRAGNAGGVRVTVNGASTGNLGATGGVIERSFAL